MRKDDTTVGLPSSPIAWLIVDDIKDDLGGQVVEVLKEFAEEFERVRRRQRSNITLSTWSIKSHLVASKRDHQLALVDHKMSAMYMFRQQQIILFDDH